MFILLTAGHADHVRGPSVSVPSAALEPVARQGGVFILGAAVLADPAHAAHHDYLMKLPQMDSSDPAFPPELDEDE